MLKAMKGINIGHVILIELLLIVAIFAWIVTEVRYDVGNYDILINTNFIGALVLVLASSVSLLYAILKRLGRGILLLFFTLYLLLGFLSPYIANFPYYFHRDVYLHLPYSLVIARTGHIPLYADRWDVSSFPGTFMFYSILMEITGIDSINVIGVFMAINYVIILASIVMFFVSFSHKTWHINEDHALMIMISLLPFIARYAPRPSFPFRFHLAYLQLLLYIPFFIALVKNSITRISTVVCLVLIYVSMVFAHPFFSLYILIASLLYMVVLHILARFNITISRARTIITLLLTSIIIIFLIHLSYVAAIPLLRQTYSLIFKSEEIPRFFETSIPINIESQSIFVQLFTIIIRFLWRATVLITISYVMALILMVLTRKSIPVLGASFGVAAIVISIPLIVSFLWWERSLTFIGITLVIVQYEALHILLEKGLSKSLFNILPRILLVITILSIVTSSLIIWESPRFSDDWHGMENTLFLETIARSISSPYTYIGVYSNIEFTYYKVIANVTTSNKNIFDPLSHIFYENLCSTSYPYALSQKDPDYRFLSVKELADCRSIVWSSGISYIFR
jgi:hypothetical protein